MHKSATSTTSPILIPGNDGRNRGCVASGPPRLINFRPSKRNNFEGGIIIMSVCHNGRNRVCVASGPRLIDFFRSKRNSLRNNYNVCLPPVNFPDCETQHISSLRESHRAPSIHPVSWRAPRSTNGVFSSAGGCRVAQGGSAVKTETENKSTFIRRLLAPK
jgi:hypothetical protein